MVMDEKSNTRLLPAGLTLRANFGWTFSGSFVHAASYWGILTALAKMGSADLVGKFILGLAVAAPITAIAMLQLRSVQATDAAGEYTFADYLGTRIVMTVLGMLIIIGIALFGQSDRETSWIVLLVGLSKSVECISEVIRGLFQRFERMDISGRSLIIKGPTALGLFVLLLWLTGQIVAAVVGLIVVGILVLVCYDLPNAKRLLQQGRADGGGVSAFTPSFKPVVVRKLVRRALPLGIGACLLALQANIPRYVLSARQGDAALGYFGAMAYFLVAGTMIVSALGQSAAPRLAFHFLNDVGGYRRLFGRLNRMGLVMGVLFIGCSVLLGKPLLTFFYRPEYAQYHFEFILLSIGGAIGFLTFFYGSGLVATRVFGVQLIAGIVCSVAAIVLSFSLIPRYGVRGAAITTIATHAITLAVYMTGHRYVLNRRWNRAKR